MKVALVHNETLPVLGYGGTERVVWWLAKGLAEAGVEVTLACRTGSRCDFARVAFPDFDRDVEPQLPDVDVFHYFNTPARAPERPYLVTIGGNGKPGESFLPNTAFVSRNHAVRHGAVCFVYNGLDPSEYRFQPKKERFLLFLAKASWRVKNVNGAIRLARASGHQLQVLGGSRRWLNHWRGIHWQGNVGGERKADFLARARGLLFPVLWNEPFGIAVTEALVSGTPVLASSFGSLPELVPPHVGVATDKESGLLEAIDRLDEFEPEVCREWALSQFHYRGMASRYLELYERVLSGESLNPDSPRTPDSVPGRFRLK